MLIYHLAGEPDQDTPEALTFDQPLDDVQAVVVDLSEVTFFCSTALNALLRLRMDASARHLTVHLAGVRQVVARVLDITDTGPLFPRHTSLDSALGRLAAPRDGAGNRPRPLVETFADLAQTLVGDFDLADTLDRIIDQCATTCGADGVGLIVQDTQHVLRDIADSGGRVRHLEDQQMSTAEGPCIECVRTGRPVLTAHLAADLARWPRFVPAALNAGFTGVRALPLRHRGRTIGAMNLFDHDAGRCTEQDTRDAQTFADLALLAVLQPGEDAATPIVQALHERAAIERATGMLAHDAHTTVEQSRSLLRTYAARTGQGTTALARALVSGRITTTHILTTAPRR
ncbi:GAF domain-containing protein [Kitasatospora sp. MBT63]|uniref:GAF domain-containing protein n=1 Tax=Kitasatospora sp. MBT63 TaxID=1444768 RepID=UPI00068CCD5B|nr:GAF domain-containing protein [Kitasatospora sp. MBT63]